MLQIFNYTKKLIEIRYIATESISDKKNLPVTICRIPQKTFWCLYYTTVVNETSNKY